MKKPIKTPPGNTGALRKLKRGPVLKAEPLDLKELPEVLRGFELRSSTLIRKAEEHELAAHNTDDEELRETAMLGAAYFRGFAQLLTKHVEKENA